MGLGAGLATCMNLHTLSVSGNILRGVGGVGLGKGLATCVNLHTLDASCNFLGAEGGVGLGAGLATCVNLHTLDIGNNELGSQGGAGLGKGLATCVNLHTVNACNNELGAEGGVGLAKGLATSANLSEVDMRGCVSTLGALVSVVSMLFPDAARPLTLDVGNVVDASERCVEHVHRLNRGKVQAGDSAGQADYDREIMRLATLTGGLAELRWCARVGFDVNTRAGEVRCARWPFAWRCLQFAQL